MFTEGFRDSIHAFTRSWLRLALIQLLVLLALTAIIGVAALVVQALGADLISWMSADPQHLEERAVGVALVTIGAIILLVLPVQVAGLSAMIRVVDRSLARERQGVGKALILGLRRVVPVLGAVVVALAFTAAALVATPVLSAVGVVGLVLSGAFGLVRRRRARFAASWPSWRVWAFIAIPFSVFWRVASAAVLAPAASVLDSVGPIQAMKAGDAVARGRRWAVLGLVAAATICAVGLSAGAGWLATALWGEMAGSVVAGLVQLVALPLPIIASVALYRRAAGPAAGGRSGEAPSRAAVHRNAASATPVIARVAIATIVALVLPVAVTVTPGLAAPAEANGAASPGAYVVTTSADTTDASVLLTQKASCLVAGPDCSIRAALRLAEQDAADGESGVTIAFAGPTDVTLVAPLTFAPDTVAPTAPAGGETPPVETPPVETPPVETPPVETPPVETPPVETPPVETPPVETPPIETPPVVPAAPGSAIVPGLLSIVGGSGVTLDGSSSMQLLSVVSEHWDLDISRVRFENGWMGGFAGGLSAGVPHTTLTSVVFENNNGSSGGGAVFARDLTVLGSTFINNRASGWSASVLGGSIRATGTISVVNSTFAGSAVGDQFTPGVNRGSDIYADATMTVVNSTFLNYQGGSLRSAGGTSTVTNSLFSSDWTGGGLACTGLIVGGNNRSQEGDTSCPGTAGVPPVSWSLLGERSDSGVVPVFPLTANGNPAIGAGAVCPLTDALGTARPASGCDLGAVEFDGATSIAVEAIPSSTQFGSATVRATVTSSSGAVPGGSVTFTLDGSPAGSIPLDDPTDPNDDPLVAEVALDGLEGGRTYSISANLDAVAPFDDSAAEPIDYVVQQIHVAVGMSCPASETPGCASLPWRIADTASLSITVTVDDDGRDGSILIARDVEGSQVVVAPVEVVDGEVDLEISATDIGAGASELFALYASDDGELVGASTAHPVLVLRTPTVTIAGSATTGVYGDPGAGAVTVVVGGDGPTPAGSVSVLGRTAVLDAAGTAVIDLSRLSVAGGQADLTAEFWGDEAYAAQTSNTISYQTTRADTTTEIADVAPAAPQFGQEVTVPVRVVAEAPSTAGPVGSVVLIIDGATFGPVFVSSPGEAAGESVFDVIVPAGSLAAGTHAVVAEFSGDGNFADSASPSSGSLTIAAASTITAVTATPTSASWGDQVTLAATVDASSTTTTPTGNVVFTVGSTTLGSVALIACAQPNTEGCATATLTVDASALGVGTADIVADYEGTNDFAASAGVVESFVVNPATPIVTVTAPASITYGNSGVATISAHVGATVPSDGTTVTVTAVSGTGPTILLGETTLSGGTATVALNTASTLPPGEYTISAAIGETSHTAAAVGTASLSVAAAGTNLDLDSISGLSVIYGRTLDVYLTVETLGSDLAPEGDIVVTWSGIEVGRTTLSSADDSGEPGQRSVTVAATFGAPIAYPSEFWLTAHFEPATGFTASELSSGSPEERRRVTVQPVPTVVSVETQALLGHNLEAVATVATVGESVGITPGGWITFTVIGSGLGDLGSFGPVPLVDGQASLASAVPGGLKVTLAGTWSVRATYTKDSNPLTSSVVPQNTAVASDNVGPGESLVTATAPQNVEFGVPFDVEVDVLGAAPATGSVRVQLASSGIVISDEIALVDGGATVSAVLPALLSFGSQSLVVRYLGNGTLDPAVSEPFAVAFGPTSSSVTVTTSSQSVRLYPGIVGAQVQYSAAVTTRVGEPAGFVNFYRGSEWIGQGTVVNRVASMSTTADTVWAGDIVAEFTPYVGTVASGIGRLAHSWVKAPVIVDVIGNSSASIGTPVDYTSTVRFDLSQFPFLPDHLRPSRAPMGAVTLSDGAVSCTSGLTPSSTTQYFASGTCAIPFSSTGSRPLTSTFDGDAIYAAAASPVKTIVVSRGAPTLTIVAAHGGASWGGLSTIPVAWRIDGPPIGNGEVTIKLGSSVVCSSASLSGSCDVAIPAFGSGITDGDRFTLEYSGSPLWKSASKNVDGTIVACVPTATSRSVPADSAEIQLQPLPNCGDGTGYFATTPVRVNARAADGRLITGFAENGWPITPSEIQFWNGGTTAAATATVRQFVVDGALRPFEISAYTKAECVPVTFRVDGISSRLLALNVLRWDTQNACGHAITSTSPTSLTAMFEVGATVNVSYFDAFVPDRTTFYQWDGPASDRYATSTTFTVGYDGRTFVAAFGPVCYTGVASLMQPTDGTLTATVPAPNCSIPRTGATGWTYGTRVSGELVASPSASRTFFDGWTGDTTRVTFPRTSESENPASAAARPFSYAIEDAGFTLGAKYGRCAAISTSIAGDRSLGVPGTVTIDTPSNCPLGTPQGAFTVSGPSQSNSERWFREGTTVALSTAAVGSSKLRFLGWGGITPASGKKIDTSITVTLTGDVTATAAYGTNANCRPIAISSLPAGALTLTSSYSLGANACEPMYGPRFFDQGTSGNGITISAETATPDADGSEIVFAWATSPPGSPSGQAPSVSNVFDRTSTLSMEVYGTTEIVAFACQFVAIGANVRGPDGTTATGLGAANIDRLSQAALSNFVRTPAADCSVGADPRSGYAGYGWLAGTQLLPVATANPVAYRFTGWSGDVTGTGDTPDAPVTLAGAGNRADGDNYHARIAANFDAICYTLNLPSDADKLEVVTAPNCPGMDASKRMYLGGTAVVLHAPDKGDTLFRNWVSGTDEIDADPRWASVIMSSDRTVIPYYSTKSAGEQLSTYGGMVGELLAVTSKKFVGLAAASVSAYFKVLVSKATLVASGIGYIAQGLEYLGVEGAAIDGMKNASAAMNSMISMLFAPLDCITAWSAGGSNTAIYAAQNLIGSAIVSALSSGAQQQAAGAGASTLAQLKSQAMQLKGAAQPAVNAASAIASAKTVYEAAASGNIGWESSAYDAWASQESLSVYSTCMKDKVGGTMTSVMAVGG